MCFETLIWNFVSWVMKLWMETLKLKFWTSNDFFSKLSLKISFHKIFDLFSEPITLKLGKWANKHKNRNLREIQNLFFEISALSSEISIQSFICLSVSIQSFRLELQNLEVTHEPLGCKIIIYTLCQDHSHIR